MKSIMVVDNKDQLKALEEFFLSTEEFRVVNALTNVNDMNIDNYDFIIVNVLMNGLDGVRFVNNLSLQNCKSKIIVTGQYLTPIMIDYLRESNISYIINGNYSFDDLLDVLIFLSKKDTIIYNNIDVKITNLLHVLGVPSHVKGFNYIREGIKEMYNDSSLIGAITKELYPNIARKYNTTESKVERAIRHAIEVAWIRGDYEKMEEIFGNSVDYDRAKPTNSEFIATLADRIRLEKYI